ncbi:MAG: hypothetical protein HY763_00270 [Planctomycetes bacterium]|nr:hypothetical protein [Planctomycetota bacterium]
MNLLEVLFGAQSTRSGTWSASVMVLATFGGAGLALGRGPLPADERPMERRVHLAQAEGRPGPGFGPGNMRERGGGPREEPPGGPRGNRGDDLPGLWPRMSSSERTAMERFIEERFPQMYQELERAKIDDPQRYDRRMSRLAPEMRHLMELGATDPERADLLIEERRLDVQIRQLAQRLRSAEDEARQERGRTQLRELCGRMFDVRHRRREMEIRDLESRIAELRARHAEAAQQREATIDRAVEERLNLPQPPVPEGE